MFGPNSIYHPLMYCFIIGAVLPVPFYFLHKKFPKSPFRWRLWNIPLIAMGASIVPQNPANSFISAACCAFFFQFFMYRYHHGWWKRYNYIIAAGLDAGAAFGSLLIFIVTNLIMSSSTSAFPAWWGNDPDDSERCTYGSLSAT